MGELQCSRSSPIFLFNILKSLSTVLKNLKTIFYLLLVSFAITGCGTIFDYEGDCSVNHNIKFKYDMNMLFADAFANTVTYVNLYAFDVETGKLVASYSEEGDALANPDYLMPIDRLPGEYDLVAWCGDALTDSNFSLSPTVIAESLRHQLMCKISCGELERDTLHIKNDIGHLWHGTVRVNLVDKPGSHVNVLSLTKNTNNVRILLQNISGKELPPDLFEFKIFDNNGLFNSDNKVIKDHDLIYHPWAIYKGETSINTDSTQNIPALSRASSLSAIVAEFTTSRILAVYNKEKNKKVLSIPLKDYILMVKGMANKDMSDQEYLDRENEFVMTLFLDENGDWLSSRVIINSWHLVLQNEGNLN